MPARQQPQPQILRHVGILIFVHQDIAEPALILFQHVRVFLEDHHHMQQQIAEIDRVQLPQTGLILRVKLDAPAVIGPRIRRRYPVGRQRAVLPAVDDIGQLPRRPALVVDPRRLHQLFQQPDLIVGVEDGEVRFEVDQFRMPPQQLDADRMEGAQPGHPLDALTQKAPDPLLHLARRLVGKGHRHD